MLHGRAASLAAVKGLRLGKLSRKAARGEGVSVSCSADEVEPLTRPIFTAVFTAACTGTHGKHLFSIASLISFISQLSVQESVIYNRNTTSSHSLDGNDFLWTLYILDDLANECEHACEPLTVRDLSSRGMLERRQHLGFLRACGGEDAQAHSRALAKQSNFLDACENGWLKCLAALKAQDAAAVSQSNSSHLTSHPLLEYTWKRACWTLLNASK